MNKGRMFVCGDIHGCLDALMAKLDELGFDKSTDHLYALGDLVDRGPDSMGVLALLDEWWFDSIQGNHEVLMLEAYKGDPDAVGMHVVNGGAWFAMLTSVERGEAVSRVRDLPVAMTVTTPTGRKIGLVHADMPGADWGTFLGRLSEPSVRDYAQWARMRVNSIRDSSAAPITGVDHVYFGHTPQKQPVHAANMSWIDTGCFATGNITVIELL